MGTRKYPIKLCERAVRLHRESDPKPVIRRLAEQLNVHPEALRNWIRQAEADAGERDDRPTTAMVEENRQDIPRYSTPDKAAKRRKSRRPEAEELTMLQQERRRRPRRKKPRRPAIIAEDNTP